MCFGLKSTGKLRFRSPKVGCLENLFQDEDIQKLATLCMKCAIFTLFYLHTRVICHRTMPQNICLASPCQKNKYFVTLKKKMYVKIPNTEFSCTGILMLNRCYPRTPILDYGGAGNGDTAAFMCPFYLLIHNDCGNFLLQVRLKCPMLKDYVD